jgi:prophage DNA circulation protein
MSYEDRLRAAKYRAPSGAIFELQFDEVERAGGKKAAVHEFPQQNTASVQDLGNVAEKFPMSVYFTGPDYDTQADAFWAALAERGAGSLQHPRFGDVSVLPLSWTQSESMVDELGRAEFKVEFLRVQTATVFPLTTQAAAGAVGSAVDDAVAKSDAVAAAGFDPASAADKAGVKANTLSWLDQYQKGFAAVLAVSEDVQTEANRVVRTVTSTIDDLLDDPAALFASLSNLAELPASIATSVVGKLDSYREQIVSIALMIPETYAQAVSATQALLSAFGWSAAASTVGEIETREEAVAAADAVADISDAVTVALEGIEAAVPDFRGTPDGLAELVNAASTARASLLERAFSLRAEHWVTLATERTPLDLVAEFYGGSIDSLDEFIRTNALQGDEILLIPAGRAVVYYV